MSTDLIDRSWIERRAAEIAGRAERELAALVGVSSPSGDREGAEEAVSVTAALLPDDVRLERPPCSTAGYAPDLLATLAGGGSRRLLLLGHLDTVFSHAEHRPLEEAGEVLHGSGTVDMKGGIVIALGVMRALAVAPDRYGELALLAVTDEEWRTGGFGHAERFAGYDACLCFEAGELDPAGEEAVVVRRKAASTVRVRATGVAAHSGVNPDQGSNALLGLASAAQRIAAKHDPDGAEQLTAVPTVLRCGEAFNVVPADGELICDLRAESAASFQAVLDAVPASVDGVELDAELVRRWPGMDTRRACAPALEAASRLLGRAIVGTDRGGASDASHVSADVPLAIDGLGPRGGAAHSIDEYVIRDSFRSRSEVALALAGAILDR